MPGNSMLFNFFNKSLHYLFSIILLTVVSSYANQSALLKQLDLSKATLITTCHELQAMNDDPWPETYILMNDIDCSEITNFEPIGSSAKPFVGRFEGEKHTIYNLTIEQPKNNRVGLFGNVSNSIINNVSLKNFTINVDERYQYVGGLIGRMVSSNISNSHVDGKIEYKTNSSDRTYVGGFIGWLDGTRLLNSSANVKLKVINTSNKEKTRVGGFIGYSRSGTAAGGIYSSYAISSIEIVGDAYGVGGFIGEDTLSKVSQSYAKTNINAPLADRIGGFVGLARSSDIYQSYSVGDVVGKKEVGGFIGYLGQKNIIAPPRILNNYSKVNVRGEVSVGGFVGYVRWGLISNKSILNIHSVYAVGLIQGRGAGGLVGYGEGGSSIRIMRSYWDKNTTQQPYTWDNRGVGRTTVEMRRQASYLSWDFENIWYIDNDRDYPRFQWQSVTD